MSISQGSHVNGVMPQRIGRGEANLKGLRVFLRLHDKNANNVRKMGGSGAGGAPIQMSGAP